MTDNEIIKGYCNKKLCPPAQEIINRQKGEIERLKKFLDMSRKVSLKRRDSNLKFGELNLKLIEELKTAKSEARKEFVERLKENLNKDLIIYGNCTFYGAVENIDNLLKEMESGNP